METTQSPRLPKPSLVRPYAVVWRNYGVYRICAYSSFAEAYRVFDYLIALARVTTPIDEDFAVYILFRFVGFDYDDNSRAART